MKKLLNIILTLVNNIIPKNNRKIIFLSIPDFSDNSKKFYEFIKNNKEYECIWIVKEEKVLKYLKETNIKSFKENTLSAILNILTAKYIVSTHNNIIGIKAKSQIYISLWHGMPLKNMYYLENIVDKNLKKIDYLISTSKVMRLTMATTFNLDPKKVLITGQPRNDAFFNNNKINEVNSILEIDLNKYSKIIFYIPTFRNGIGRTDGIINNNNLINLAEYDENSLNDFLVKNNYLLVAKLHPLEESSIDMKEQTNIKILDSKNMLDYQIILNEILNLSDILITDYSSVYFDYLILDKPILFTNIDEAEYMKNRGFVFDNPDFWRPGPKVNNIDDFIKEIEILINDSNYYKRERDEVNSLVNIYKDNKSSERIFNNIFND